MADAEAGTHPLSGEDDDAVKHQLVTKSSTLVISTKPTRPTKRKGLCQSCQWFKESPRTRWQFALFLLFSILAIICIAIRFGNPIGGDVIAGILGLALSIYGANHFRLLLKLTTEVNKFGALNANFKQENGRLSYEVDKLDKAHTQLSQMSARLKEVTKGYQDNIDRFRKLDERLRSLSDDNIQGLQKLQEMSKTVKESFERELVQHERDILHKVMNIMEFRDDKEGLNREEFDRFLSALPLSFQRRFSQMDRSFKSIAGSDSILDFEEFRQLADEFAVQEARAGGSKND
eukprot:CAMPEP_0197034940 /NCGR_PEP_ID=MMETSP1384-20130603/12864_1 /TAXON_ID=29189 /ORGANISM="Ammonia sp." /LENGTH=289 /DNA_ID=CAMNT_0042464915 /DNA_START=21 /DNA_END=890 /DNA_ORIENTATION=-